MLGHFAQFSLINQTVIPKTLIAGGKKFRAFPDRMPVYQLEPHRASLCIPILCTETYNLKALNLRLVNPQTYQRERYS